MKHKGIFFDRDGVINDNKRPVNKPRDLILYDGVKEALKRASEAGYDVFIVTNQGGIELGHISHEDLKNIHESLNQKLEGYCNIREIAYCPDFKKQSQRRKPEPGMLLELAEKHGIDLKHSWMVGDMETDITAGIRAGCRTAKVGKSDDRADINEMHIKRSTSRKVDLEAIVEEIIKNDSQGFLN